MKIGLLGLPKRGKTTLFNLLTGASVATSRYDAGRAELHTGIARGPDPRVDPLSALFNPKKTTDEARLVRGFTFLSQKPILHVVNVEESAIAEGGKVTERYGLADVAGRPHSRVGWVSAVIEAEIARLEGEEQQAFLADLGLEEPAINRVLRDCFALLGLISFFTTGEDEVRAWPIPGGTRAQDAAGAVHSDTAR